MREPVQHAASLLRQHERFLEIHARDGLLERYMEGIGHFDFGANLRPIDFDGWLRTARHSDPGTIGFWLAAYAWLNEHAATVRFVPYDHFCADPGGGLRWLADVLDVKNRQSLTMARGIRLPASPPVDLTSMAPSILTSANAIHRTLVQRSEFIPAID